MVVARQDDTDLAFLPLTDPEFDLSDRGVAGREPAGPIDVFLSTDRGAYRAGDTIVATALARDGSAAALEDLPLTAILYRPMGSSIPAACRPMMPPVVTSFAFPPPPEFRAAAGGLRSGPRPKRPLWQARLFWSKTSCPSA